jgi:hypothetical protein
MPSIRAAAVVAATVLAGALAGCGSDAEDSEALGGSWTATLDPTSTWSSVYPRGTGTAKVSSSDGTSVQLTVSGLGASVEYMAHVHEGECDEDPPGGGHWLSDPKGEDAAGNIIQLQFTSSDTGTGETTVSEDLILDDRAESVVVHAPEALASSEGLDSDRVLCGDLEEG